MRLTTLARVRARTGQQATTHDTILNRLVNTVSHQIEAYLGRYVLKVARTQQYDIERTQKQVALAGYPVESSPVAVFRNSTSRDFTVDAIDDDNYYLDRELGLVNFDQYDLSWGQGVFQAAYTGGLAYTLDRVQMTVGTIVGAATVGNTVTGSTSGATGTVVSWSSPTIVLTVDVDGNFQPSESITEGAFSAVVTTVDRSPLLVSYPDIVEACETQVEFDYQRRDQLGLASLSAEGGSVSFEPPMRLLKGVQDMLEPHRSRIERR